MLNEGAKFWRNAGVLPRSLLQRRPIAVSLDVCGGDIERSQIREHFARHRPRHDVSANHDLIHPLPANRGNHCLERREISVDVVNGGDAFQVAAISGVSWSSRTRAATSDSVCIDL